MSGRKAQILEFISKHRQEKGFIPSTVEIAAGVGLKSGSSVHRYLNELEEEGTIRKHGTRSIEIVGFSDPVKIIKYHKDVPSVIQFEGRRYVYDPMG